MAVITPSEYSLAWLFWFLALLLLLCCLAFVYLMGWNNVVSMAGNLVSSGKGLLKRQIDTYKPITHAVRKGNATPSDAGTVTPKGGARTPKGLRAERRRPSTISENTPEPEMLADEDEEAPMSGPAGSRIVFKDDRGRSICKYYQYRPHGIVFGDFGGVVEDFHPNSYSRHLGIQKGWAISEIDGMKISNKLARDATALAKKFSEALVVHKVWPLRIAFHASPDPNEPLKTFFLEKQPVGFEFSKRVPVVVSKVHRNSYAASLGIQENWVLKEIGKHSVEDRKISEILEWLSMCTKHLDPVAPNERFG